MNKKLWLWSFVERGTALITFITVLISSLQLSFGYFSSVRFQYLDLSVIAVSLMVLTGLIVFYKYRKNQQNESVPHSRLIIFIYVTFALVSLANLGYAFGKKSKASYPCPQTKTRIVMMLPLCDQIQSTYQDGMRQMYGYAEFLKSNNSEATSDYEFVPIDHLMDYKTAKEIIIREVNSGTKYFISTMSKVNETLTAHFEEIISSKDCHYLGQKPILICTITSSPKVTLKSNLIYRFYVRSHEEGKQLAHYGNNKNLSAAIYIVVNDEYGSGAIEEFKKNWNGTSRGIKVNYQDDDDDIAERITKEIKSTSQQEKQVIFIAHYGNGIDNIIKALKKAKMEGVILATSTLSIRYWQEPIKKILANYEWYTCVPDYKDIQIDNSNDDVIKNFMTHTLKKLIQTIKLGEKDTASFDDRWKMAEVDLNLDISYDKGDAVIPMKIVDKGYFK